MRAKFLKPFVDHKLLKFIGLNKKFNPGHVKAFYCNLEQTLVGIKSKFKDCVVKFNYMDFTKYLGLTSEGSYMFVAKSPDYDRIRFVVYFQVYGIKHWYGKLLYQSSEV